MSGLGLAMGNEDVPSSHTYTPEIDDDLEEDVPIVLSTQTPGYGNETAAEPDSEDIPALSATYTPTCSNEGAMTYSNGQEIDGGHQLPELE